MRFNRIVKYSALFCVYAFTLGINAGGLNIVNKSDKTVFAAVYYERVVKYTKETVVTQINPGGKMEINLPGHKEHKDRVVFVSEDSAKLTDNIKDKTKKSDFTGKTFSLGSGALTLFIDLVYKDGVLSKGKASQDEASSPSSVSSSPVG
jgi:hypothetical protein